MIRRTPAKAVLAVGTLFGIGLLFAGVQPAAAAPPAHAAAHGYRSKINRQHFGNRNHSRYNRGYSRGYNRGWNGSRNTWGWNSRSPYSYGGSRWGAKRDLDRDGIRNGRDRDRDGDGVRNGRDSHPKNPLRR
jgi:hypothetical protein